MTAKAVDAPVVPDDFSDGLIGGLSKVIKTMTLGPAPRVTGAPVQDATPPSAVMPVQGGRIPSTAHHFIEPKLGIEGMSAIAMMSNAMRPLLDAMAVNLHASGYRIEPKILLDSPNADKKIADAIYLEKAWAKENRDQTIELKVSDQEIVERKGKLEHEMRMEYARIHNFLESCCVDMSYTELCKRTAFDVEGCGNGGWEVIRRPADVRHSPLGALARLNYVPGWTIRLRRVDDDETPIMMRERTSAISYAEVPEGRRFRVYGHVVRGLIRYFKEFGDPRMVSQLTGEYLKTPCTQNCTESETGKPNPKCLFCKGTGFINPKARERKENEPLANELYHWKVWCPIDEYGIPRWAGCLFEAAGSTEASRLNYNWFKHGTFDATLILAWGINVDRAKLDALNADLQECKSTDNQGRFLLLEGQPAAGADPTKMNLTVQPLTTGRGNDALYQSYDQNNADKLRRCWRISEALVGVLKQANRASISVEEQLGEQQVFGPNRTEFDFIINGLFMTDMNVKYHRVITNAPSLSDPEMLAKVIVQLTGANVLTVGEARKRAEGIFGEVLPVIAAAWTREPNNLLLAKLQNLGNMLKAGYTLKDALAAINAFVEGGPAPALNAPEPPPEGKAAPSKNGAPAKEAQGNGTV